MIVSVKADIQRNLCDFHKTKQPCYSENSLFHQHLVLSPIFKSILMLLSMPNIDFRSLG